MSALQVIRLMHREDARAVRAVGRRLKEIAGLAERAARCLRRGGRIFLVGAGTSGRLAAAEAAECPPTFGLSSSRIQAVVAGGRSALSRSVEGAEDDAPAGARELRRRRVSRRDLVIGISASGTTPFVRGALREARRRGAGTALVSSRAAPGATAFETGPEVIAGSTRLKAGTAAKLALNMITTAAMVRLGRVYGGLMVDVQPTNRKLRRRAERIVRALTRNAGPRRALRQADGNTKVAILMLRRGLGAQSARRLLQRSGGSLREALRA
jgi:N-acetylmuramic acid 6-phosphate etherase